MPKSHARHAPAKSLGASCEPARSTSRPAQVIGRKLFGDVISTGRNRLFREQLESFIFGYATAHSYDFTIGAAHDGGIRTRVLLAHICGRSADVAVESILVQVRKA